jgi:SAM-dependent methyltransferase
MSATLSTRLAAVVSALPLRKGMRVLEIGCGPGAAARAVARVVGEGHVLAIDRSAKAIAQARAASKQEVAAGWLRLRRIAIEDFALKPGEARFDLAFAVRVGALDGRHPEASARAMKRIAEVLKPRGRLFVGDGADMREVALPTRSSS